jgi:hypothetical protein
MQSILSILQVLPPLPFPSSASAQSPTGASFPALPAGRKSNAEKNKDVVPSLFPHSLMAMKEKKGIESIEGFAQDVAFPAI